MNTRDKRMLIRAMNVAHASTKQQRHGAVIAHGGKVLAVGVNSRRVHPNQTSEPWIEADFHAEVAALRSLRTTVPLSELTVYVARVSTNGYPLLSKPCAACEARLAGFGRIVWTTERLF